MNCFWCSAPRLGVASSKQGDVMSIAKSQYLKVKNRVKKTVTFVLLGSGESGKSTILRQVTNLYGKGLDEQYCLENKPHILRNVMEGCVDVLLEILSEEEKQDLGFQLSAALQTLKVAKYKENIDQNTADAINACLDNDRFIACAESGEFYLLQDSWLDLASKMKNYPEWGGEQWIPTKEDIFLSRIRTIGIIDTYFQVNSYFYKMIDVSGQRQYRKKYLVQNYLQGIDVILYVQSLSEYNLGMFENQDDERFADSLQLWTNVVNSKSFKDCSVVLFFNKLDIFKEKYMKKKIPLPTSCSDFEKPPLVEEEDVDSCEKAKQWYQELYLSRINPENQREVIIKFTTATDEDTMKPVINAVSARLVNNILVGRGLAV